MSEGLKPLQAKKLKRWCDDVRPRVEPVSDNDSEGDEEEDDDDSDNDLEIVIEQSGTADSTDDTSGGTEAPVKKAKIMLTEEQSGNLLSPGFRNRFKCHLLHSNRDGFRNRFKCHLLKSIILWLSLIAVNFIDYHFHLLH